MRHIHSRAGEGWVEDPEVQREGSQHAEVKVKLALKGTARR